MGGRSVTVSDNLLIVIGYLGIVIAVGVLYGGQEFLPHDSDGRTLPSVRSTGPSLRRLV